MDDKILVEITVPASAQTFDVYIPLDRKMGEVTPLVAAALSDLSRGKFKATADTALCDRASGRIFDIDMEVAELGIQTGSCLMLI